RSLTDTDYFARRQLRQLCTQPHPSEDFLPQASEILPGLYLSDMYTATNPAVLARLGVTHLVSVQRDAPPTPALAHLRVPLDDARGADLQSVLAPAVLWIERARRRGGTVLVHCVWGMSRSPALVIAFLMAAHRMPLGRAWAHVRARRAVARPNAGFVRQLAAYGQV
ncbi:phosphatases II, partial [Dentipellis sp. KUC8613]